MTGARVLHVTPNLDIPAPEPWEEFAACKGADPEIFYPPKGASSRPARDICATCPVSAECLDFAQRHSRDRGAGAWGVWAGLLERERRDLRAAGRREAA